jgi:hypothetical protein
VAGHQERESGGGGIGREPAAGKSEADMLDMGDDLLQQLGAVVVVERVDDATLDRAEEAPRPP